MFETYLGALWVIKKMASTTVLPKKDIPIYTCIKCDYTCRTHRDYNRHIETKKHNAQPTVLKQQQKTCKCSCGKSYYHRASLFNHKIICTYDTLRSLTDVNGAHEDDSTKNLIVTVIKQNNELVELVKEQQKQLSELIPHIGSNNNNTTNNNVSLNVFLNENCKDAMNITDFTEVLKIQLSDLDKIGNSGFAAGISDIIVKELKSIDRHKRPVHCSDTKRETLYIRDEDRWEKEDDDKQQMNKMINAVAKKNIHMISLWKEAHPECNDSASKFSDQYNRIILGALDYSKENNDKIIKNIAKEVKI